MRWIDSKNYWWQSPIAGVLLLVGIFSLPRTLGALVVYTFAALGTIYFIDGIGKRLTYTKDGRSRTITLGRSVS